MNSFIFVTYDLLLQVTCIIFLRREKNSHNSIRGRLGGQKMHTFRNGSS